ncbi:MAG: hypothetical protein DMG21_10305 [Acidobacteria bacterium]|nr:MAG: hypothetical protein DMG21_10305 [Acidobacteriota bacterium]
MSSREDRPARARGVVNELIGHGPKVVLAEVDQTPLGFRHGLAAAEGSEREQNRAQAKGQNRRA